MRAHYCWQSVGSVARALEALTGSGNPFALPGTRASYPPDRPVHCKHLHLDAKIDPAAQSVEGHVTLLVLSVVDATETVRLDASDLEIIDVYLEGRSDPASFRYDGRHLDVSLWLPLKMNDMCNIVVRFRVEKPRLGLYFVHPTPADSSRPLQAWSQNQDDDARFWFPCIDSPALRMTTSTSITVPKDFVALSNGVPGSEGPAEHWQEGWHTFTWQQNQPHPIYLLNVVVGPFVEHVEPTEGGTEVRWYHLPGRAEDAARAFGKTTAMLDFFSSYLAIPYPWDRYSQVAVSEFVFGGMENTTLTTVTDRVLPDARAALDYSADSLVAHELAHQWFGDYVTCRDWSEGWLNEGFATYLDALFKRHDLGQEEFDYQLLTLRRGYVAEDAGRYRRPIVTRRFVEPIDVFDHTLYNKGAWVLHMLRAVVGEEPFRRGLHVYLRRFGQNQAETSDLRRAMEDGTGRSLGRFFDQWIHRGGYPVLDWKPSADVDSPLSVTVTQTGFGDDEPWSIDTCLLVRQGETEVRLDVRIDRASQTYAVPSIKGTPDLIVLDPDYEVLASVKADLSATLHSAILNAAGVSVGRRVEAAQALGRSQSTVALKALIASLSGDAFWGVRAAVAKVLGTVGTPDAADALVAALGSEQHPKARRGVVEALAALRGSEVARAAISERLQAGDDSYFVEAELARGVGRHRGDDALALLDLALGRDSFNDVIRSAALDGLASLRTAEARERILARLGDEHPSLVRVAAVRALGTLARDVPDLRPAVLDDLASVRADPNVLVQLALIGALERVAVPEGIPTLQHLGAHGADGRVKRRSQEAVLGIRRGLDRNAAIGQLRDDVETLRAAQGGLRARLDKTEARLV